MYKKHIFLVRIKGEKTQQKETRVCWALVLAFCAEGCLRFKTDPLTTDRLIRELFCGWQNNSFWLPIFVWGISL